MPLSLRLPADIEHDLAAYGARHGVSKSALIVRSIREFLAAHTQPSAFALYEAEMDKAALPQRARGEEARPHKLRFRELVQQKRAQRSGAGAEAVVAAAIQTPALNKRRAK